MISYKTTDDCPRTCKGDLTQKRHEFSGVQVYTGECGDHYCPGHTHYFLLCSCGFVRDLGESIRYDAQAIDRHRQEVTEYHLGLQFK